MRCFSFILRLFLLLCVYLLSFGDRTNTATLNTPENNTNTNSNNNSNNKNKSSQRIVKHNELKSVLHNILQRHAANSDIENLQATLADVRPAAAILCNDNDFNIEFDLNDDIVMPKNVPIRRIFAGVTSQHPTNGRDDVSDSDNGSDDDDAVFYSEIELPTVKRRGSKTPWDYEQISAPPLPRVSVNQYGTNYFQHNSYTMPSSAPSSSSATLSSSLSSILCNDGHKFNIKSMNGAKQFSTPTITDAALKTTTNSNLNDMVDATTAGVMMATVMPPPATTADYHLPVENILIIENNRTRKDKETNSNNNNRQANTDYQTPLNIKMSNNGKIMTIISQQPHTQDQHQHPQQQQPHHQIHNDNNQQLDHQMRDQGLSSPQVEHVDDTDRDRAVTPNWSDVQIRNNATTTTKRSAEDKPLENENSKLKIIPTGKKLIENMDQVGSAGRFMTNARNETNLSASNMKLGQISPESKILKTLSVAAPNDRDINQREHTASPKVKPKHREPSRKVTLILGKGKPRRPAGTNYYYYYTKANPYPKSKRIRDPFKVYIEPIAYEALDNKLFIKNSKPLAQNSFLTKHHHRNINNLKYINIIGKHDNRPQNSNRHLHNHHAIANAEDDDENCQQHNENEYSIVKRSRNNLIKDIIATEKKQHRLENNVHYYRELRPFEEALDGDDCLDDEKNGGKKFVIQKPNAKSSSNNDNKDKRNTNSNLFEYFTGVCNNDDEDDDADGDDEGDSTDKTTEQAEHAKASNDK